MKDFLIRIYLRLPVYITRRLYSVARLILFPDSRTVCFDKVFTSLSSSHVEGDYLEFGVFRGSSFITAATLARKHRLEEMRFYAFDSFEGLPNAEGNTFRKGEFASPEHLFKQLVYKSGVEEDKVTVVKGFFDHSLQEKIKTENRLVRAAVVHVDCDLYSSTVYVLRFIEGILDVGTFLIFDDWYSFSEERADNMGERKAFREWPMSVCFDEFYDDGRSKVFVLKGMQ